ncbi:MAG: imidazolonepropionase [Acidobacteria bacterium 21-70-11]|nr:MAG: imidazolonepropionase [Acidobacteria bacterium 21-70-11]OYW06384.1 MAG: imidazolonepropionase [Acidobacteria bacterium 37-71-11]HQT94806.1 imidazolonepropionase [Thermoanaerobaculaceae bacterium]HQU33853.1 imidazolonepropionase [Thermoanaerobaculaceae bacterium]
MSLLIQGATVVATPRGTSALAGPGQSVLDLLPGAVVRCDGRDIVFVGEPREHDRLFGAPDEVLDAAGGTVLPGFVDPHTHLPFAGYREDEFDRRIAGARYAEIAAAGGGIVATVAATRRATFDELLALTLHRLDLQLAGGTTTTEAKSGYGLDLGNELKQLRVLREAGRRHPVEIVPTAMPAHEVPPEWRHDSDGYVELVVSRIHPAIAAEGLAEQVDVFCEWGVFTPDQTRRLLADAGRFRWRIHLHADELCDLGGAALAAEVGAAAAAHLLHASAEGIAAMARRGVIAIALPGVSFFLRERFAPVRALVDAGVPVAVATDCNPGSSHTESMPAVIALACLGAGLSSEEAIIAATLNAAAALGRADRLGSVETGKQADLVVLDAPSPKHLVYHFGVNLVRHVVKAGRVVVSDGARV